MLVYVDEVSGRGDFHASLSDGSKVASSSSLNTETGLEPRHDDGGEGLHRETTLDTKHIQDAKVCHHGNTTH